MPIKSKILYSVISSLREMTAGWFVVSGLKIDFRRKS